MKRETYEQYNSRLMKMTYQEVRNEARKNWKEAEDYKFNTKVVAGMLLATIIVEAIIHFA